MGTCRKRSILSRNPRPASSSLLRRNWKTAVRMRPWLPELARYQKLLRSA